jgi:hypothetical protein
MTLKHFMAAQMRKPSGWFGSVILRRLLNRMKMAVVESTLSRIGLEPHHHLLEIGFGGGAALALVSKRLITGIVTGVDFSPEMVREAERRFGLEIANGHLRVQLGDIAALPFASATFDRVFTINTIYFWPIRYKSVQPPSLYNLSKEGCRPTSAITVCFQPNFWHFFEA